MLRQTTAKTELRISSTMDLQSVIDNFAERDVTILMGDFDAKIGSNNIAYEKGNWAA